MNKKRVNVSGKQSSGKEEFAMKQPIRSTNDDVLTIKVQIAGQKRINELGFCLWKLVGAPAILLLVNSVASI